MSENLPTVVMPKIYEAIQKVMQDVGAVKKSGYNSYDKYNFRSIDDVYNALNPALTKNGVFIVPEVLETHEGTSATKAGGEDVRIRVKVKYTIYAVDGSHVIAVFVGEGTDRKDKATNKAMQASYKYMLTQVFCLAFENMDDGDRDDEHERNQKQPPKPAPKPAPKVFDKDPMQKTEKELNAYQVKVGKFKGKTLEKLDIHQLNNYVSWLENSAKEQNKEITGAYKEFYDNASLFLDANESRLTSPKEGA